MSTVTITRRGEDRARAGHPWIYRSDITGADAGAGDLVQVQNERDSKAEREQHAQVKQATTEALAHTGHHADERKTRRAKPDVEEEMETIRSPGPPNPLEEKAERPGRDERRHRSERDE